MSLRLSAAALVAFAVMMTVGALTPGNAPRAVAQDAQTDAMIWHFNVYRMQNGAAPLYTHPSLSTLLQNSAQQSADACGPVFPAKPSYASKWSFFYEAGGETADTRWNYDWSMDPMITSRVADPDFNSVGVGRALSHCSQGWTWTVGLAKVSGSPGGPYPTPTGPVQPTPSPTALTPSPSPTPSNPTPTPSPGTSSAPPTATTPHMTPSPTESGTPGPTPTGVTPSSTNASPGPTTAPANGDVNCDGDVGEIDGMLILFLAADLAANTPCLAAQGVNCTGLVDEFDVLALFRFLANLNPNIPGECPPIGVVPTPAPTVTPTVSPGPTITGGPTPTAATTVKPGPTLAPDEIGHCFLALASYDLVNEQPLSGAASCFVDAGANYACYFPGAANSFTCDSSLASMPDRDCYVYQTAWVYCAAVGHGTHYQCNNSQGVSQCLPVEDPASPIYDCVVDETAVTCLTEAAFPDFHCTRTEQSFACATIE